MVPTEWARWHPTATQPEEPRPPPCPMCAGTLVPARDLVRCTRCGYSFCVGCEPGLDCGLSGCSD
jgi:hypothetical protein